MTNTQKYLEAVKDRIEKATPGPWHIMLIGGPLAPTRFDEYEVGSMTMLNNIVVKDLPTRAKAHANFIAKSRTDIVKLVAALETALGVLKNIHGGPMAPLSDQYLTVDAIPAYVAKWSQKIAFEAQTRVEEILK